MNTIDKEDVDITRLFFWNKKVEIFDMNERSVLSVYMRVVGDNDIQQARAVALRESAKFRQKLKHDEDTRLAYIPFYEDFTNEELIAAILTLYAPEVTREALREVDIPLPKEPKSDADLEVQEEYRKKVDEWPSLRRQKIDEYIIKKLEGYEQIYKSYTKEQLASEHERVLISEMCKDKMVSTFRDYSIYLSIFADEKFTKRYFNSYEEFLNLPTAYKEQFVTAYDTLDIDTDELKK